MSTKKFDRSSIKADKFFANTGINIDAVKEKIELSNYEKTLVANKKPELVEVNKLEAAPSDWNFFPAISLSKKIEMVESISTDGLYVPIILWDRGDKYMILAGHNRVNAYKALQHEDITEGINKWENNTLTPPTDDINEEYLKIPSFILQEDELTEDRAKRLIIDTNYVARPDDKSLMPLIIKNRMSLDKEKNISTLVAKISKELNISNTKVYEDMSIANNIIPEISQLYFDGVILKKQVLKFNRFDKNTQKWIYENYQDKLTNKKLNKLNKNIMSKADLEDFFEDEYSGELKEVDLSVEIPIEIEKKFKNDFTKWVNAWKSRNL